MDRLTTAELLSKLRKDLTRITEQVCGDFLPLAQNQIRWRPAPDRWSVGECLDHLNIVNLKVLPVLTPAITAAPPLSTERAQEPYKWGWLGRKFVESAGPNTKLKVKAPKLFRPRPTEVGTGIVEDFLREQERLSALIEAAEGRILFESRVPSPAFKWLRLRLGDYLAFIVAHEDRHVRQAVRVMNDPEFPGPTV